MKNILLTLVVVGWYFLKIILMHTRIFFNELIEIVNRFTWASLIIFLAVALFY